MSVAVANAIAEGLRKHGVVVHFAPGWDRRGNGQTSDYRGGTMHHTATGYGTAPAILINGRPDLAGPLCNSAGNADGSVTIIAAHPANHAGASGGRSMGPLPVTRSFNRHVWGHEIVYPGDKPMTPAQYRTACILGGVIAGVLRAPNPEVIRAHAETSITGKWDPGYAPGRTIDMGRYRADIWPALHSGAPVVAGPPPTSTAPPRKGLTHMRSLNLDNPNGQTPQRAGVLTIDAVGKSLVLPAGARAWVQFHAFYPNADMSKIKMPLCFWLAFIGLDGKQIRAENPFQLPFRKAGAVELPPGTAAVEVGVYDIPPLGAVGFHLDAIGHAP